MKQDSSKTQARHSTILGTQCIDSTWGWLNRLIPPSLKTKDGNHKISDRFVQYIWAVLHRINHRDDDGFALLGGIARASAEVN